MTGAVGGAARALPKIFISVASYRDVFLPFTLVMALLSRLGGTMADRFGVKMLLTIGPAMIMIEREWDTLPSRAPSPDGRSPVVIFVYVPDVDETVARAVEAGAQVLLPLQDQFWGDRIAWIMDPSGHVWTVASRIEDTSAEERTARWNQIRDQGSGNRDQE